jgi:hypothetical protein
MDVATVRFLYWTWRNPWYTQSSNTTTATPSIFWPYGNVTSDQAVENFKKTSVYEAMKKVITTIDQEKERLENDYGYDPGLLDRCLNNLYANAYRELRNIFKDLE